MIFYQIIVRIDYFPDHFSIDCPVLSWLVGDMVLGSNVGNSQL